MNISNKKKIYSYRPCRSELDFSKCKSKIIRFSFAPNINIHVYHFKFMNNEMSDFHTLKLYNMLHYRLLDLLDVVWNIQLKYIKAFSL